jgi:hypothetical protein
MSQGLDTPSPVLETSAGTKLACQYDAPLGSYLIFAPDSSRYQQVICVANTVMHAASKGPSLLAPGKPCSSLIWIRIRLKCIP